LKVLEKYLKGWEPCSVLPLQNMSCSLVFPPKIKPPGRPETFSFNQVEIVETSFDYMGSSLFKHSVSKKKWTLSNSN
jgi:hypothetical protein